MNQPEALDYACNLHAATPARPLTLSLSPYEGEREMRRQSFDFSREVGLADRLTAISPLPFPLPLPFIRGEGEGEGSGRRGRASRTFVFSPPSS
jgi:hypothetical protein